MYQLYNTLVSFFDYHFNELQSLNHLLASSLFETHLVVFLFHVYEFLQFLFDVLKVPNTLVMLQALDAIDNGINQYDTDQPPKYVNNTHLSSRVGRFNLDWTDPDQSLEKENAAFEQAMVLAGSEFMEVFDIFYSCLSTILCKFIHC
jgi:uncharacterized UPF0160 family protein